MASRKVNLNLPLPVIELHIEGQWVKAEQLSSGMANSIQKGYNRGADKFARAIIGIVRRAIRSGQPPHNAGVTWEPLSPATIRTWGAHGIYDLKGMYARSIGIHRYKSRTFIGIPMGSKPSNPRSKLTLNKVAIILENGDDKIPARPLWAPSLKSAGGLNKLKTEIIHGIRSQLYSDFGINPKQVR